MAIHVNKYFTAVHRHSEKYQFNGDYKHKPGLYCLFISGIGRYSV